MVGLCASFRIGKKRGLGTEVIQNEAKWGQSSGVEHWLQDEDFGEEEQTVAAMKKTVGQEFGTFRKKENVAQIRDLGQRGSVGGGCCEEEMTTDWGCLLMRVGGALGQLTPSCAAGQCFGLQTGSSPALSPETDLACSRSR